MKRIQSILALNILFLFLLPFATIHTQEKTIPTQESQESQNKEGEAIPLQDKNIEQANSQTITHDNKKSKKDEGIISLILRGGWTMLGLAIISTIIIAFSIERFFYFKRQNLNTRGFNQRLEELLETNGVEKTYEELSTKNNLICQIASHGLKNHSIGLEEVEQSLEKKTNIEIGKLERGLNLLANFGNLAPLLGFFGTVVGMRASFLQFVIQKAPTAQDLAGGVEEALITTAAGLLVAIPTYLAYNLFIYQIDYFATEVEQTSSIIHDHLKSSPQKKPKAKPRVAKKVK